MNIPDEAVTVARDAVLADAEWIDEETLRAALEAAAPFIESLAYDRGNEDGSRDAQRMADRRAVEVLNETVRHIENAIQDHLDGAPECERLLFKVEVVTSGRIAELQEPQR